MRYQVTDGTGQTCIIHAADQDAALALAFQQMLHAPVTVRAMGEGEQ
jgi:hypothetical protein